MNVVSKRRVPIVVSMPPVMAAKERGIRNLDLHGESEWGNYIN
jgi:hypothetical protein